MWEGNKDRAMLQELKKLTEHATGFAVPRHVTPHPRKPALCRFEDDGQTPNNPHFPLIHYPGAVTLEPQYDPAAVFEVLFAAHGWDACWRNGIYDFLHFHTHAHEVLGIALGHAKVQFGGRRGRCLELKAGDVVILPAGTGHKRISKSRDLLVVGAYPQGHEYNAPRPGDVRHTIAVRDISVVGVPGTDPVYGRHGPLRSLWRH